MRLDDLVMRARGALRRRLTWDARELSRLRARLRSDLARRYGPVRRERLRLLRDRLGRTGVAQVAAGRAALARAAGKLDVLSPLASLGRGYAIVRQGGPEGTVVRSARALTAGDVVSLLLGQGRARATILDTEG